MNIPVLYMIPAPLWEGEVTTIPQSTISVIYGLTHFIVEKAKTTRKYIKDIRHPKQINELNIFEMDRTQSEIEVFRQWVNSGYSVGVISEAGCPGIADPGTHIVRKAHELKIRVVPCTGPNSIIQALMASGFSGQQFSFHGYLPNKKAELVKKLKQLEQSVLKNQGTQIFIETPYRSRFILNECLYALHDFTFLSVACQISGPAEWVLTKKIVQWKKTDTTFLEKVPCIFSIGTIQY